MKLHLNTLPWQSLSAAIIAQMVVAMPAQAAPESRDAVPAGVSCVVPDLRTGEPVVTKPAGLRTTQAVVRSAAPKALKVSAAPIKRIAERSTSAGWTPVYRGTGVSRMKDGAAKARVLRLGTLWTVDPSELGVSEDAAIAALLKAGAASARSDGAGKVYFRARDKDRVRIATRAAGSLGGSVQASTDTASDAFTLSSGTPTPAGVTAREANLAVLAALTGKQPQEPALVQAVADSVEAADPAPVAVPAAVLAAPASDALGVDVAMLRIEGSTSLTSESFIDALPGGMTVYPFGTGYAVHVPEAMTDGMWSAIDGEGKRVLLVGASAPLTQGANANDAIRFCGAESVLRRFPTPQVERVSRTDAVLGVEDQKIGARSGDIVMVVKTPTVGTGIEVALMRFVGR